MKQIVKLLSSPAILYVGGAIAILLILKSILPKGKTKSEKNAEAVLQKRVDEIKNSGEIWTTQFWKGFPAKAYTDQQSLNLAELIKNSWGFFNDNEIQIEGVFRTLKYQTNVSQIADAYVKTAKQDLHSELIGRLSKNELQNIYDIISRKPL